MTYYQIDDRRTVASLVASCVMYGVIVALFISSAITLVGCGSPAPKSMLPPEQRVSTDTVAVPKPITCFDEKTLPLLPKRTPVAPGADTDAHAAAAAADAEAFMRYAVEMNKQTKQCLKGANS